RKASRSGKVYGKTLGGKVPMERSECSPGDRQEDLSELPLPSSCKIEVPLPTIPPPCGMESRRRATVHESGTDPGGLRNVCPPSPDQLGRRCLPFPAHSSSAFPGAGCCIPLCIRQLP